MLARHSLFVCALLASLLAGSGALAQRDPNVARAKKHYQAGQALYELGNFTDAIREFSAGYAMSKRVEFLVNLGQCYRKLGDRVRAKDMYQKYLNLAPADAAGRVEVADIVKELEQSLAESPPGKEPAPQLAAAKPAQPAKPVPVEKKPDDLIVVAAPLPAKKPFIKRHWWIIPVSIVAAAGVATGLGVGLSSSGTSSVCANPPKDSISCFTVMAR